MSLTVVEQVQMQLGLSTFLPSPPKKDYYEPLWPGRCLFHPHLCHLLYPSEQSCAYCFRDFSAPAQLKPSCDLLLKSKEEFYQAKHVRD